MSVRVLVCGGRDFRDPAWMAEVMRQIHDGPNGPITLVISGAQRSRDIMYGKHWGADWLAIEWALEHEVDFVGCPAKWEHEEKTTGKRALAGPKRNRYMLEYHRPDLVVAFPGDKGTEDLVKGAMKLGIHVRAIQGSLAEMIDRSWKRSIRQRDRDDPRQEPLKFPHPENVKEEEK
jgi:SLOG family YspA-like protein